MLTTKQTIAAFACCDLQRRRCRFAAALLLLTILGFIIIARHRAAAAGLAREPPDISSYLDNNRLSRSKATKTTNGPTARHSVEGFAGGMMKLQVSNDAYK